ncbi:MAG: hypothetical protein LBD04_07970 [Synergistaceae bacterium]|nr:hypothetical protein [Synergistaceae bacterium]
MREETEIGRFRRNMIRLTRQAALDREFRDLCLKDGGRAYRELTGEILPERYALRFAEPGKVPGAERQICLLPEYWAPTWLG